MSTAPALGSSGSTSRAFATEDTVFMRDGPRAVQTDVMGVARHLTSPPLHAPTPPAHHLPGLSGAPSAAAGTPSLHLPNTLVTDMPRSTAPSAGLAQQQPQYVLVALPNHTPVQQANMLTLSQTHNASNHSALLALQHGAWQQQFAMVEQHAAAPYLDTMQVPATDLRTALSQPWGTVTHSNASTNSTFTSDEALPVLRFAATQAGPHMGTAMAPASVPSTMQPAPHAMPGLGTVLSANPTTASLYVKGLPAETDEVFLYQVFGPYGSMHSCKIKRDTSTGLCSGVGFVNFHDLASATHAMRALDKATLSTGGQLHVRMQAPRAERAASAAAFRTGVQGIEQGSSAMHTARYQVAGVHQQTAGQPLGTIGTLVNPSHAGAVTQAVPTPQLPGAWGMLPQFRGP